MARLLVIAVKVHIGTHANKDEALVLVGSGCERCDYCCCVTSAVNDVIVATRENIIGRPSSICHRRNKEKYNR